MNRYHENVTESDIRRYQNDHLFNKLVQTIALYAINSGDRNEAIKTFKKALLVAEKKINEEDFYREYKTFSIDDSYSSRVQNKRSNPRRRDGPKADPREDG